MICVCFVTRELDELASTSGNDVTTISIYQTLAASGFEVSVLVVEPVPVAKRSKWQRLFRKDHQVSLEFASWKNADRIGPSQAKGAKAVYDFFKRAPGEYDLVLFDNNLADAYYCLTAKQTGLLFEHTGLGVQTHGPSKWRYEADKRFVEEPTQLMNQEAEQRCIERADFVISPSQDLVDWMRSQGWSLPKETLVLPKIFSDGKARPYVRELRRLAKSPSVRDRSSHPRGRPLVSVVIPHHDRPLLLAQAVESVQRQTYSNFEIIVVDDGSREPFSLGALEELEAAIDKLRVVRQSNRYLGAARNTGISNAQGSVIAFLDDDDYWHHEYLEKAVGALLTSGADCVTTGVRYFYSEDSKPTAADEENRGWLYFGDLVTTGVLINTFGSAGGVCQRKMLDHVGGFPEVYGAGHEDWGFYAKAALRGAQILALPELLRFYRISPDSMIRSTPEYDNFRVTWRAYEENGMAPLAALAEILKANEQRVTPSQQVLSRIRQLPGTPEAAEDVVVTAAFYLALQLGSAVSKVAPPESGFRKLLHNAFARFFPF